MEMDLVFDLYSCYSLVPSIPNFLLADLDIIGKLDYILNHHLPPQHFEANCLKNLVSDHFSDFQLFTITLLPYLYSYLLFFILILNKFINNKTNDFSSEIELFN